MYDIPPSFCLVHLCNSSCSASHGASNSSALLVNGSNNRQEKLNSLTTPHVPWCLLFEKKKLSCPVLYLHSHLPYSPSMSTHMKQYLCHWRTLAVVFSRKGDQLAPLHPYNCLFTHCRCLPKSRLVHAHAYASPHPNFCRHVSDHLGYKLQSLTMSSFYTNNSCTCTGCP